MLQSGNELELYFRNVQMELGEILKACEQERSCISKGSLVINRQPNGIVYYEKNSGKTKGISRDRARVHDLARRGFIDLKINDLNSAIRDVQEIQEKLNRGKTRSYLRRFEGSNLDEKRITLSEKQFIGIQQTSRNEYKKDLKRYATKSGRRVRSKSEMTLANIYEDLGIPYIYEERFVVDVTDYDGVDGAWESCGRWYKEYFPDFTILLRCGRIKIHEHFGMIGQKSYRDKAGEKIISFTNAGIVRPEDMFFTYEKDVEDTSQFIEYLKRHVLPFV